MTVGRLSTYDENVKMYANWQAVGGELLGRNWDVGKKSGALYFYFHWRNFCLMISATVLNNFLGVSYVKKCCFRLLLYTLKYA
jgi:hypothetical protein